ncbi:MAG: permease-like cell division protein FtsX [Wenzhouxiangella sp.]|nr:permease-like cell division protein FtsX [Wenzhouxiangella sp.]
MTKTRTKPRTKRLKGPSSGPARDGLRAWARRHAYGFFSSLGELIRRPVASIMTTVVLALALSLPLLLHLAVAHLSVVTADLDGDASVSVFVDQDFSASEVTRLGSQLSAWSQVLTADPISPEAGLAQTLSNLGLAGEVDSVSAVYDDNPLPWVLALMPQPDAPIDELVAKLSATPGVEQVIVDLAWLERLGLMLSLGERMVLLLATLLVLAVVFVTANAVRMEVHQRRHQIEVMALVGATPGFIRRPFLYSGFWLGTLSSVLAIGLVYGVLAWLQGPLSALAASYGSAFELQGPSAMMVGGVIVSMGLTGIVGSLIAVNQHLSKMG